MRILLDNRVHRQFGAFFPGHEVTTAHQIGLADLENGDLLSAAAARFDVMIATDKNIKNQHNLAPLTLPVIELAAADTRIEGLMPLAPFCATALKVIARYRFVSIHPDATLDLRGERS